MDNGSRPDDIRRRLAAARAALAHDAHAAVTDARTLADWREHFHAHPWLFCGGAAALGFFLVPRRNHASDGAPLTASDAKKMPRTEPQRNSLGTTVLGLAASFAARQVGQYASHFAAEWMKSRRQERKEATGSQFSDRGPLP